MARGGQTLRRTARRAGLVRERARAGDPLLLHAAGPMNILVVEDDARSRELLVRYLSAKGHAVATAEDGSRALESVAASEPDLVLLDGNLPVMDGWAVLETLRKFSRVPVIMVTVRDATRDKLAGLGLGADDYITKPFDLRELEARIQAGVRRYQAEGGPAGGVPPGEGGGGDGGKEGTLPGEPGRVSPRGGAGL